MVGVYNLGANKTFPSTILAEFASSTVVGGLVDCDFVVE